MSGGACGRGLVPSQGWGLLVFEPIPAVCSVICFLLFALSIGTGSSILSALQDLFWLSKSKVEKQLQIISVLQWVLTFLIMGKQRPLARSKAS